MTDVIVNEKMNNTSIDNYYRYGVYFYTLGMILLKNNKNTSAKANLHKAEVMWKDILNPNDPSLSSLYSLLKICDKKN